jgi:hypothetical protein
VNTVAVWQAAFTFYSFIFGFAGPLAFILLFYILVIVRLRKTGRGGIHFKLIAQLLLSQ